MQVIENIKLNGEFREFFEVSYDDEKQKILWNKTDHLLFVWKEDLSESEKWVMIYSTEMDIELYMKDDITMNDLFMRAEMKDVYERKYESFDVLGKASK